MNDIPTHVDIALAKELLADFQNAATEMLLKFKAIATSKKYEDVPESVNIGMTMLTIKALAKSSEAAEPTIWAKCEEIMYDSPKSNPFNQN